MNKGKERLVGLDLFRIGLAILVLVFHSILHIGCNYGILGPFINMGAIAMTAFFMLSGYSLYYVYGDRIWGQGELNYFYKKRVIGVMPVYYVVAMLYVIFLGTESIWENL